MTYDGSWWLMTVNDGAENQQIIVNYLPNRRQFVSKLMLPYQNSYSLNKTVKKPSKIIHNSQKTAKTVEKSMIAEINANVTSLQCKTECQHINSTESSAAFMCSTNFFLTLSRFLKLLDKKIAKLFWKSW